MTGQEADAGPAESRSGRQPARPTAARAGSRATRTTTTASTPSTWCNCASSCWRRSRRRPGRSTSTTTAPHGASSWPACRARSPSAASSTCCATASSTARSSLDLFYGTPSPGNATAAERFAANRFSVTRQLRYSRDETQLALDLCLFINGLPVATFELKNSLTKQTVEDAVEQYKRDRDPRELLFQFGRCMVHFAVDDQRGAHVHAPEGQGLVVPAVQPGLERRRGQSAQPGRASRPTTCGSASSPRRA